MLLTEDKRPFQTRQFLYPFKQSHYSNVIKCSHVTEGREGGRRDPRAGLRHLPLHPVGQPVWLQNIAQRHNAFYSPTLPAHLLLKQKILFGSPSRFLTGLAAIFGRDAFVRGGFQMGGGKHLDCLSSVPQMGPAPSPSCRPPLAFYMACSLPPSLRRRCKLESCSSLVWPTDAATQLCWEDLRGLRFATFPAQTVHKQMH